MTTATVGSATVTTTVVPIPAQPVRGRSRDGALATPWSGARLRRPHRPAPTGFPSLALIELARFGR